MINALIEETVFSKAGDSWTNTNMPDVTRNPYAMQVAVEMLVSLFGKLKSFTLKMLVIWFVFYGFSSYIDCIHTKKLVSYWKIHNEALLKIGPPLIWLWLLKERELLIPWVNTYAMFDKEN